MAINKKFIHFKRKSTFQRELEAGNILNTSIVFIADAKQIYLNGSYFSENTLFNLSDLLSTVSGDLTDTDTSNEAIVKLYKQLKEVDSNTDSLIKILMQEISTLEETLTDRIDNTDLLVATELNNINQKIDNLVNITYSELKSLRDSNKLISGRWYRITDYACTTTQEKTRSAGHQFDILVLATSENTLSEEARAIRHEGDTYFQDSNLNAWKIWYTLDNDPTKYAWADATNGKGVIYRMIDEWQNDCPYDFKNIQFQRWAVSSIQVKNVSNVEGLNDFKNTFIYKSGTQSIKYAWDSGTLKFGTLWLTQNTNLSDYYYTFTWVDQNESVIDASVKSSSFESRDTFGVHNNIIGSGALSAYYGESKTLFKLNNIVFASCYAYNNETFWGYQGNVIGKNSFFMTFGNDVWYNTIGSNCFTDMFGNDVQHNVADTYFHSNVITNSGYNKFMRFIGNAMIGTGNVFEDYYNTNYLYGANWNKFGSNCYYNVLGQNCSYNTLGNNCIGVTLVNNCQYNIFESGIESVKLLTPKSNYFYIEQGNKYINITANSSTLPTTTRTTISSGIGTSSSAVVEIQHTGSNYATVYARNSNGELVTYNPADHLSNVIAEEVASTSLEDTSTVSREEYENLLQRVIALENG